MYTKLGNIDNAYRVFKGLTQPDLVSWTFADQPTRETFYNCDSYVKDLSGHTKLSRAINRLCKNKCLAEAIQLLNRFDRPKPVIYVHFLHVCCQERAVDVGRKVHAHAENNVDFTPGNVTYNRVYKLLLYLYRVCGCLVDARALFDKMPERDVNSWNSMVSGYVEAGDLGGARVLFDKMPERNHDSWKAMIFAYVRYNQPGDALNLFRTMMEKSDKMMDIIDSVPGREKYRVFVPRALWACSAIRSLRSGMEIHGYIVRCGLDCDEVVLSSLSDMYGKCGSTY